MRSSSSEFLKLRSFLFISSYHFSTSWHVILVSSCIWKILKVIWGPHWEQSAHIDFGRLMLSRLSKRWMSSNQLVRLQVFFMESLHDCRYAVAPYVDKRNILYLAERHTDIGFPFRYKSQVAAYIHSGVVMIPMQMQARLSGYMEGKGKPVLSQERARLVSIKHVKTSPRSFVSMDWFCVLNRAFAQRMLGRSRWRTTNLLQQIAAIGFCSSRSARPGFQTGIPRCKAQIYQHRTSVIICSYQFNSSEIIDIVYQFMYVHVLMKHCSPDSDSYRGSYFQ